MAQGTVDTVTLTPTITLSLTPTLTITQSVRFTNVPENVLASYEAKARNHNDRFETASTGLVKILDGNDSLSYNALENVTCSLCTMHLKR
jgi:hypothetical protein